MLFPRVLSLMYAAGATGSTVSSLTAAVWSCAPPAAGRSYTLTMDA